MKAAGGRLKAEGTTVPLPAAAPAVPAAYRLPPTAYWLAVLVLCAAAAAPARAGTLPRGEIQGGEPDFKIGVSAGLAGQTRLGWVPVRITIDARRDFEGELVARLRKPYAAAAIEGLLFEARRPLKIAAGSQTEYQLYLRHDNPHEAQTVVEAFLERKGRRAAEPPAAANLAKVDPGDYLVCAVSERPGVVGALKLGRANQPGGSSGGSGRSGSERQFIVAQPDLRDLPDRAAAYAGTDLLLLYQTPFEKLSEAQKQAIVDHAWRGGVVVLAARDAAWFKGPEVQRLVAVREVRAAERAAVDRLLRELAANHGGFVGDTTACGAHEFTISGAAGEADFVAASCGLGTALLWRLDPDDPAVRHWPGMYGCWLRLASKYCPGKPEKNTYGEPGQPPLRTGRVLAESLDLSREHSVSGVLMVLLVILYLVLVGPVNYFVLRRLDLKALSIITIPLMAAAFVLINFAVGYLSRGVATAGRRVTVGLAASGSERAECVTYQSLFPASSMLADVATDGKGLLTGLATSLTGEQEAGFAAEGDERFTLERYPLRMWEMFYFQAESMRSWGAAPGKPGRVLLADHGDGRFSLTSAGARPLKDCLIAALPDNRRYAWVGELPTGATRTGTLAPWTQAAADGRAAQPLALKSAQRLWLAGALGPNRKEYVLPESDGGFAGQAAQVLAGDPRLDPSRLERRGRLLLLARPADDEDLEPLRFDGSRPHGESVSVLMLVSGPAGGR